MSDFDNIINYLNETKEGITLVNNLKSDSLKKEYSDVLDQGCHQYVDLVQEGGGTLGLSLVGFCFVLEYVGIRFLRLAGTSAGAINTLFLAAIGNNKSEAKTPKLFEILQKMEMESFIDGNCLFKAIIKSVISKNGWFLALVSFYVIFAFLLILFFPIVLQFSEYALNFYLFFFIIFFLISIVLVYMYLVFKKANYGINKGDEFEKFIKDKLIENGINKQEDLDAKAKFDFVQSNGNSFVHNSITFRLRKTIECYKEAESNIEEANSTSNANQINNKETNLEGIKDSFYKYIGNNNNNNTQNERIETANNQISNDFNNNQGLNGLKADYTFITIDLMSQNKIELPKHAGLFWENKNEVNPASYVRASMSIPIFFEPLLKKIDKSNINISQNWKRYMNEKNIPDEAIFIDGGAISNFPINIFHNPNIIIPRLPTIGIRINDSKEGKRSPINNLLHYIGKIFNTLKTNYDKDFLIKNSFYEKHSIADINTYETDAYWLDFYMSEENKRALFLKGVEAGIDYLQKFNWAEYKTERQKIYFESLKDIS